LVGLFSLLGEHRVHVGVVAGALQGESISEFFVIELSIFVGIEFVKESVDLGVFEDTAESFQTLLELSRFNSAEAIEIKVSEDLPDSLALIISSMGSLSNFFEHYILQLFESSIGDESFVRVKAPGLEHKVHKVIVLLSGQARVDVRVVLDPGLFRHVAVGRSGTHQLAEVSSYSLTFLFSSSHSGVRVCVVVFLEEAERHGGRASGDNLPCVLDDCESLVHHVGLK